MLVVLVFSLIPTSNVDDQRQRLDSTLDELRRATRFATNEAILRNSITRITINIASSPQEYAVEYSTEGGLALPDIQAADSLSISEREAQNKITSDLDSQFQRVPEFGDGPKKVPEFVYVTGIANVNIEDIVQDGKAYVYFYPTGERDSSIIFISTESELATLEIPAFENTTFTDYHIYSEYDLRNVDAAQESKMKELRDEWLKK